MAATNPEMDELFRQFCVAFRALNDDDKHFIAKQLAMAFREHICAVGKRPSSPVAGG